MFLDSLSVFVDSIWDDGFLDEVRDQLAALGITEADIDWQLPLEGKVVSA